ncbi:efflux transporter, RND family, MFP subunit [Burkholderia gladioli]|uniref:efflux RND transporter periplasmic adaptor subunit n=1 Tax=Burkholderia gladioli TaxID=28095 RepID=UPI0005A635D3|nr:efflux RND transporter periplasmic adaptor subunit [Burkholderia gladioli]AJW95284.1 efflux transporter, RND family, MFP subunit [Burkholderia gladioli]ASD83139.1 efflux RND transporter periplasmic adaptor subunit [Burkholderia gladioli pv. gladioli]AWY50571.1 efflux RND transporter periplasmic adaptor subunit [Burkholderia gladioli pv. gladioli]SPV01950.1 putative RND multidrug efflux membrane fusion protein MexA precursor [Burkholderia gladioli]
MNRLRFLFLAAPALALLLGAAACRDRHPAAGAAAAPATPVSVIALHRQSVPLSTELAGRVVASLESEVRPQISGVVRERLFVEGSDVQAGQPLYRIDPAPYQAAYDSAKAALQRAEAAVPTALARADRNAILSRAQAMSKQEYETSVETLAQARASVALERAALETARINLAYTTIRAPISGRIDKSSLTPGALVTESQGTALTTIRLIDPINVDLTESSANLLNLRQAIDAGRVSPSGGKVRVRLRLENGASYPLEGTLQFSESSVNAATGTVTLRAVFPNPQRLLLPGMYARAVLETGAVRDAFLVPQRAIGRNPRGEATALFVRDGKVVEQVLEGAREHGNDLIVERGVHDGDQVIVEGSLAVRDGDAVKASLVAIDPATGRVTAVAQAETAGIKPAVATVPAAAEPARPLPSPSASPGANPGEQPVPRAGTTAPPVAHAPSAAPAATATAADEKLYHPVPTRQMMTLLPLPLPYAMARGTSAIAVS